VGQSAKITDGKLLLNLNKKGQEFINKFINKVKARLLVRIRNALTTKMIFKTDSNEMEDCSEVNLNING